MLNELNFEMGEVWNYDPHEIISKMGKAISATDYKHDYIPTLEWKANLNYWHINTYMKIETPSSREKTQKRTMY